MKFSCSHWVPMCAALALAACSPDGSSSADDDAGATRASSTAGDGDSSRTSLDWAGTYSGVTPCADCPGIRTTVHLRDDGSFERTLVHIDRGPVPEVETGSFSWNEAGSTVILESVNGASQLYQVGEGRLFHLDREGQRISGELANQYTLDKHIGDPAVEGKRWVLIELGGEALERGANTGQAFLMLSVDDAMASGHTSCNSFNGPYAIKSGNRISFGENMALTMMACPHMAIEQAFLQVLRSADSYAVEDGVLNLNRARMAPLARLELEGEQEP